MKNLLSKTLISGVLASSLILVNCQKAPNRATKAQTPDAKPSAKIGDCSPDAAKNYGEVKTTEDKIVAKLEELKSIATDKLTADQKTALKGLATEMLNKAKLFTDEMQKLKLDGCKTYEGEGDKKKVKDEILVTKVLGMRSTAGKNIKAKTCDDNAITEADSKTNKELVAINQSYKVSKELGDLMSDDTNYLDKKTALILAGEVKKGEFENTLKILDKTSCGISFSGKTREEVVKTDGVMKIVTISGIEMDAAVKRKKIEMSVTVEATKAGAATPNLTGLVTCYIANDKENEAAKEVRNALGTKLVTLVQEDLPASCKPAPPATKEQLKTQIATAKSELVNLQTAAKEANDKIAPAQAAVTKAQADLDKAAEADKSAAQAKLADAQKTLKDVQDKAKAADDAVKAKQTQITELEAKLAELELA